MTADERPERHFPIFVVGYMHSGTTLVANMLKQHPDVFSGRGETKFFDLMSILRDRFSDLNDSDTLDRFIEAVARTIVERKVSVLRPDGSSSEVPVDVESVGRILPPDPTHPQVIEAVFDTLAEQAGRSHWLENSGNHVFFVDEILASMPAARFVEVVRDGRDILASKKTRRATIDEDRYGEDVDRKRLEKAYDPLWDSLSWRSSVSAGERAANRHPSRVHTVVYEALVGDPATIVGEMCSFLDLPYDPQMLEVTWANPAEAGRTGERGVGSQSVGRWAGSLSASEVAVAQLAAGRQLQRRGYGVARVPVASWLTLPVVLTKSLGELVRRLIGRWRLGGAAYFRNVLRSYGRRLARVVGR